MRWILTAIFGASFSLIATMNSAAIVRHYLHKKSSSPVLLFGGLCGLAGVLVCPLKSIHRFWPVPLVADYGCAPCMLYAAVVFSFATIRKDVSK